MTLRTSSDSVAPCPPHLSPCRLVRPSRCNLLDLPTCESRLAQHIGPRCAKNTKATGIKSETHGFRGNLCTAEFNGAKTVAFFFPSSNLRDTLSISLVKPAKILILPSFPMTSAILKPFPPEEPLSLSSLEGGLRIFGMFMMGAWCCRRVSISARAWRKRFGRTSSDRAVGASMREMMREEAETFILL